MSKKTSKKTPKEKPEGYTFGRPTKYRKEFCEKMVEYFDQPLYRTEIVEKMSASGAVKEIAVKVANDMPTFEGFACRELRINPDTFYRWVKEYPDFSEAYKAAKGMQKQFLTTHAINGNYNASFAKFLGVNNHGMKDLSHIESDNNHEVKGYGLAFDLSKKPEDI